MLPSSDSLIGYNSRILLAQYSGNIFKFFSIKQSISLSSPLEKKEKVEKNIINKNNLKLFNA